MDPTPGNKFYFSSTNYLNYRVIGNGKRKIIFLHGFGSSHRTWDDILPYLMLSNSQLIFFDLIGAGFSSKQKISDYSMVANAKAISKYLKDNHIIDFTLIGHSFGGGVALLSTIKMRHDSDITPSSLILIDPAAYKTKLPFFIKNLTIPIISRSILNLINIKLQARFTLEKLYYDKSKVTDEKVERYAYFMSLQGHDRTLMETAKQIIPENLSRYTQQYDSFEMPVLVLWGRNDNVIDIEFGRKLSDEIPNGKLTVIENCGHIPQEEQPEITAYEINSFLKQL